MAEKVRKVAKASDQHLKRNSTHETTVANWGRTGPPPSPTIVPIPSENRPAHRPRAFVDKTGQPSPLLAEIMRSPTTAPLLSTGGQVLEAAALACRRLKNGELLILLVSKRRSGKWGIPKGRINGRLAFGEVAAKEAFEEAGIKGRVSPNSIGMFRLKKWTPSRQYGQVVEVWVYLLDVTERLRDWPEKGKREIKWVSCATAARQLRDATLADLCQRLAKG